MAVMLRYNDSSEKHLNTVRRHTRLCRHISGTEELVANIQTFYNELIEKQAIVKARKEERENAYDDLVFQNGMLDNILRTTFERCKQYDRDNVGLSILKQIFPENKYSHIVRHNLFTKPDEVEKIKMRITELGEAHTLYPLIEILQKRIKASRSAISILKNTVHTQKTARSEEKMAQNRLRLQYENNYLDACKKLGRKNAEMLFPKTKIKKNVEETEE